MAKAYVKNVYDCAPMQPPKHLNATAWCMANNASMDSDTYTFFSICEIRFGGAAITDKHINSDHCYFILSGKGYSIINGQRFEYGPGDVMWIPGNADHEMYPTGIESLRFIVTLTGKDFNQTEPFIRNVHDVKPVSPPKHVNTSSYPIVTPKNGGSNTIEFHVTEIRPGGCAEKEAHADADHVCYIISGYGYAVVDGERLDFGPNDSLYIPKGAEHEIFVDGEETLRMAVTFGPSRMIMR